ncbi:MAG: putative adapitin protein, partial [Streblomastix strix]
MSQQLLSDLTSKHETHNTLALCFIANSGNAETGETLGNNVSKILMQQNARPYVIKKAALCLLHLFRKNADVVGPPANFVEKAKTLLQHTDAGVLTAVLSLIQGLAAAAAKEYEILIPLICKLLNKVVIQKAVTGDYLYDHIAAPWLVVKGFQLLQIFENIGQDKKAYKDLIEVLRGVIGTDSKKFVSVDAKTKQVRRRNAMLAVLFEGINVATRLFQDENFSKDKDNKDKQTDSKDPSKIVDSNSAKDNKDGQGGERTKEKDGRDIIQKSVNHFRYFLSFQDPDLR